MNFLLVLLASIFISLAWLIPVHYRPWVTYTGELYAFFAFFAVLALCLKQKVQLPKISLPLVLLAIIPFIQFFVGKVFFFSNALMAFSYVFAFWMAIVAGFNLSTGQFDREKTFTYLSYIFVISGALTGLIGFLQWLNLDEVLPGITPLRTTTRPYANFAQPNNMATFLLMSLLAGLYLYEKKKIQTKWLVAAASMMLATLALSQSRTSWVACLCIIMYLAYQQFKGYIRIKWYFIATWLAVFVGLIFLFPALSGYLTEVTDTPIKTADLASRATKDLSRLAIWQQMIHAVEYKPWFGYGFYQTGSAYTIISEFFQGPVWIRSAHNFILDFILWNGLIVGVPFLAYFGYWGYQLNKHVNSTESVIGILMIGVFLVHALLEFPQNYAYFLLPVGFILGIVQAQQIKQKTVALSVAFMRSIYACGIVLLVLVYRDYNLLVPKLAESMKYEKEPAKITNQDPIYVLNEFNYRIEWARLNPYSKVSPEQIHNFSNLVLLYPTTYNFTKLAKLLAFNGYEDEARHQLKMLKILRHKDVLYESLLSSSEIKP